MKNPTSFKNNQSMLEKLHRSFHSKVTKLRDDVAMREAFMSMDDINNKNFIVSFLHGKVKDLMRRIKSGRCVVLKKI